MMPPRHTISTRRTAISAAITLVVIVIAALSSSFTAATAAQPATPSPTPVGDLGTVALHGFVVTPVGDATLPVVGATVSYEQYSYYATYESSGTTTTGTDGTFAFPPTLLHDTDSIRLTVDAPGYAPYSELFSALYVYRLDGVFTITLGWLPADPLDAALDRARMFEGGNDDWEPFVWEFDGVEMVLVPAGCFMMGTTPDQEAAAMALCQEEGGGDEVQCIMQVHVYPQVPAHRVCFEEPFWIDRTEVTNAQFDAFGGSTYTNSSSQDPNYPRDTLPWSAAADLCENRGARLPTEAEWEYAARGPDAWDYPWGNTFDPRLIVGMRSVYEGNEPAGSIPAAASWVGALDLSGNVREWVADWYDAAYYETLPDGIVNPQGPESGTEHVVRGGGWLAEYSGVRFRAALRWRAEPNERSLTLGFRCVRDVE